MPASTRQRANLTRSLPFLVAVFASLGNVGRAQDQDRCPPGPDRVDVAVEVEVSFDAAKSLYSYAYTLKSSPRSEQEIEHFEIDAAKPINIGAPAGWIGDAAYGGKSVLWLAHAIDPAIADVVSGDASMPPSIANIKPGGALAGFALESPNPPAAVEYRVYGYAPVHFEGGDDEWEELSEYVMEHCSRGPRIGTTRGPVAPTRNLPRAPGAPTFSAVTANSLAMHWSEPEGGNASYEVETTVVNGVERWVTHDVAAPPYNPDFIVPNTTYVFRVRGMNAAGAVGPWSEASSVRTPKLPPEAPAMGVRFSGVSDRSLTVEWGSAEADTYEVERASDLEGTPGTWSLVARGITMHSLYFECTPGSSSWFRIRGMNEAGVGPYSEPASVMCLIDTPGPPTFVDVTDSSMAVVWTAPKGGAASYRLERAMFPSGWWNVVASGIAATSYELRDRYPWSGSYRVVALDGAGQPRSYSVVRSPRVSEGGPTAAPGSPRYLRITRDSVEFTWSPSQDARRYRVERSQDAAGGPGVWVEIAGPIEVTSYTDRVVANERYWYRVRGTTGARDGPYSPPSSVVIDPAGRTECQCGAFGPPAPCSAE